LLLSGIEYEHLKDEIFELAVETNSKFLLDFLALEERDLSQVGRYSRRTESLDLSLNWQEIDALSTGIIVRSRSGTNNDTAITHHKTGIVAHDYANTVETQIGYEQSASPLRDADRSNRPREDNRKKEQARKLCQQALRALENLQLTRQLSQEEAWTDGSLVSTVQAVIRPAAAYSSLHLYLPGRNSSLEV
jgi:hypothetical protein